MQTTITARLAAPKAVRSAKLYRYLQRQSHRKAVRRRSVRIALVFTNVAILAIIVVFVVVSPHSGDMAKPVALNSAATSTAVTNPLDQLSSADIALTVARMGNLPETTAVTNQAESQAADLAITASSGDVLNKPQVVATALKSRADIVNYTSKPGDTVTALAAKYGVTSDSIRWSNGLTSTADTLTAGTKLAIPPVNGIVYTLKAGDTADSIATKYKANKDQIIAYNDAEISGLQVGEQIIIPNATQPVVAAVSYSTISSAWGGAVYGSNGYDYGYCTWYVASQISVPSNWGNASSWAYYARLSGWNVSSVPQVGSIAQTPYAAGGEGHVAIVTDVSADGTQIKIKDMNGIAGYGRVGYSDWISTSKYPNYISH